MSSLHTFLKVLKDIDVVRPYKSGLKAPT